MMLAEKKAPQQVSAAMLIPFRRERARALRVLALAAITTTTATQGTTRRCADEQPSLKRSVRRAFLESLSASAYRATIGS